MLGDGIGFELVAGAGQAGHGVARRGAHAAFGQMKSETIYFILQLHLAAVGK